MEKEATGMSYESLNFIGLKISEIKEFVDSLSTAQRQLVLKILKEGINDLLIERSDH